MTIHASKGLEFDFVFLPGWEEGLFPHQKSIEENGDKGLEAANTILNSDWTYKPYETYCKGEKDRDDEIRVFYVGITRTKYNLFLYQPDFSLGEYRGMKHNNFWNKIRGK